MAETVTPSPELEALVRRWVSVFRDRNGGAVANLFSASDALTYIGSAEGEFWAGDTLRSGVAAYTEENPRFEVENLRIAAYECGSVGWAHWTATAFVPENNRWTEFRCSLVLVLEDAVWRVVQVHNSHPVSNLQAMGYEPHTFDDLVRAVAASAQDIGQTGIASVMFTDIVDSTTIAQTLGDARWVKRVRDHVDLISDAIAERGGKLVKSLGDGTMSTFPSAGAAMTAACEIHQRLLAETDEPRLQVRIGIHTGDVVHSGDDFLGTVVNKAARIAALARPGETRVSDATRIMVGGAPDMVFSDAVSVPLRGLDGDHLIYRLEWRE